MAFIGGSHSWRKHDHLVGHRKGVGKILLAKGLVTYRLELVRAPTCLSRIIMSTLSFTVQFVRAVVSGCSRAARIAHPSTGRVSSTQPAIKRSSALHIARIERILPSS